MTKLEFTNAQVRDNGYGLEVNGKSLENIISTALGTRAGSHAGYNSGLPAFECNCCDVLVVISPKPVTEIIENDDGVWESVKELEEDADGKYQAKAGKAES